MNKTEFLHAISEETETSFSETQRFFEAMSSVIERTLQSHEDIKIPGFGTFKTKYSETKEKRNPRTGEMITIPAKFVPKFTFSKNIKESVK